MVLFLHLYYDKVEGSTTGNRILSVKKSKDGSVEYLDYKNQVRAYDYDGDGNIDEYSARENNEIVTYKDITDGGKGNFMKKAWYNPLTWF